MSVKRSTREARVLRARRVTTDAINTRARAAANGQTAQLLDLRAADVERAADAELTAADAPQPARVTGFGHRAGRGEFRRG